MASDLEIGSLREEIRKPLWLNVTVASGLLEGVGKCSVMGPLKVDIVAAVVVNFLLLSEINSVIDSWIALNQNRMDEVL